MKKNTQKTDTKTYLENNGIKKKKGITKAIVSVDLESLTVGNSGISKTSAWVLLLISMCIIGGACALLVYSCEHLGLALDVPVYFVAVILASAATSVPDTILSIKDARKGNYDDALSNALGSNIFDICFALGFPLFLFSILYEPIHMPEDSIMHITELRIILLILTIITFFVFYIGKTMGKLKAYILLGLYLVFTLYVLGRAVDNAWCAEIAEGVHWISQKMSGS